MTIVFSIISKAAALASKSPNEVGAFYIVLLELLPEESSPTALKSKSANQKLWQGKQSIFTGEPVILSPRALILTVAAPETEARMLIVVAATANTLSATIFGTY